MWSLAALLIGVAIALPVKGWVVTYLSKPVIASRQASAHRPATVATPGGDRGSKAAPPVDALAELQRRVRDLERRLEESERHRAETTEGLVYLTLTEAFWVEMKVAVILGLFIASPLILWQIWAFIAPGLYTHERKYAAPFVVVGSVLFILGGAFALKVVTPFMINFLLSYTRPGLTPMISVGSYIDLLLNFTLAFAAIFELPLAITLASRMGLVTPQMLARNRKYAILISFVVAAILTPTPDVVTQSMMAGPLIILYEVGIISARIFGRARKKPVVPAEEPA
jgi:sec-independent protein translocase protein TatC